MILFCILGSRYLFFPFLWRKWSYLLLSSNKFKMARQLKKYKRNRSYLWRRNIKNVFLRFSNYQINVRGENGLRFWDKSRKSVKHLWIILSQKFQISSFFLCRSINKFLSPFFVNLDKNNVSYFFTRKETKFISQICIDLSLSLFFCWLTLKKKLFCKSQVWWILIRILHIFPHFYCCFFIGRYDIFKSLNLYVMVNYFYILPVCVYLM